MATDSSVFLRFSRRSSFSSFSGRKKGGGHLSASICPDPHHLLAIGAGPKKAPAPNAAQLFLSKCSRRQHVWESHQKGYTRKPSKVVARPPQEGPPARPWVAPWCASLRASYLVKQRQGSWALCGE